jgi:uncharacterized integral membrane protein
MEKLKVVSISVVLFLIVVFFDQNRAPVPVKIILGDPTPVGLSLVIVVSILFGVVTAIAGMLGYTVVRRRMKQRKVEKSSYKVGALSENTE